MTRLLAPQLIVIYLWAASALFVAFRGRARLGFTRQITDHSTFLAPYNVLMYLFSAVPNRPVLPPDTIPDLATLRANWQTIRDEALGLQEGGRIKAADALNDIGFNSFFRGGWKRFYLKWYGEPLPSAKAMCPRTVALLDAIPCVKAAMFATLAPGGKLPVHRDPYAGSLRYHLGLVTPKSSGRCRIFIDGEPYTWHDGEDLLFDETFLHTAENTTSETRVILFCDVERPLRFKPMAAVNRALSRVVGRETETRNVMGEHVGSVNRAFGAVYQVRRVGKRLKAWNRKVYYFVKYLIFGGAIIAFVATAL